MTRRLEFTTRQHTGWVRALAHRSSEPPTLYSVGCNRILSWSSGARGELEQEAAPRQPDSELALFEGATQADVAACRSHDILCLAHANSRLASGSVDGAIRTWHTPGLQVGCCGIRIEPWDFHAAG